MTDDRAAATTTTNNLVAADNLVVADNLTAISEDLRSHAYSLLRLIGTFLLDALFVAGWGILIRVLDVKPFGATHTDYELGKTLVAAAGVVGLALNVVSDIWHEARRLWRRRAQ